MNRSRSTSRGVPWRFYRPLLERLEDRLPPGDTALATDLFLPDGDPLDTPAAVGEDPLAGATSTPASVSDGSESRPDASAAPTETLPFPVEEEGAAADILPGPTGLTSDEEAGPDDADVLQDILLVEPPFPTVPPDAPPEAEDVDSARGPGSSFTDHDHDHGDGTDPAAVPFGPAAGDPDLADLAGLAGEGGGGASTAPVTFQDETASRLVLSTISANDAEEKDIGVGDLNQDGRQDLVIVRKRPFSTPGARTAVLLLNEDGVLVDRTAELAPDFLLQRPDAPSPASPGADARDVVVADLTGDGWLDVVSGNTFGMQPNFYRNLGDDADGNWLGLVDESAERFPLLTAADLLPGTPVGGFPRFCAVTAGDVTGDGALDLYFSGYAGPAGSITVRDILFVNNGEGFFTNETVQRLGSYANSAFGTVAAIDDINGDGQNDIVKVSTLFSVAPFNNRGVFVLYNPGNGVFHNRPFQTLPGTTSDVYMFAMGDLNNDGRKDFYTIHDGQDRVALNAGNDSFGRVIWQNAAITQSPRTTNFGGNAQMVDINGDGFQDMAISPVDVDIANCPPIQTGVFSLLLNTGSGAPATQLRDPYPNPPIQQNIHTVVHDFAFLDLNGDGKQDMFQALCTGFRILIQE